MSRLAWGLIAGSLMACKPAPQTSTDAGTRAAPTAAQPLVTAHHEGSPAPYRIDPAVEHPGVIEGRVTWRGPRPAVEDMPVQHMGNPDICGHTQPFEALVVDGSGGVSGIVASLTDIAHGAAPNPAPVAVDQVHCRYVPHVSAAALGAELVFTNHDEGLIHNVHAFYGEGEDGDSWFNSATPVRVATRRRALRVGAVRLLCDAGHTWMNGYVQVFPHPYFAVSSADGRFEIRNVPPGAYTLKLWHEGWTITGHSQAVGAPRPEWSPSVTRLLRVNVPADGSARIELALASNGFVD